MSDNRLRDLAEEEKFRANLDRAYEKITLGPEGARRLTAEECRALRQFIRKHY